MRISAHLRLRALALLGPLVLAGCSFAPEYQRPALPVPDQFPQAQTTPDTATIDAADIGWSEFFRDPRLQALIGLALDNNRDLHIAVQRVEEAQALYGLADSERYPSLGVGGNAQVTRNPEKLRMPGSDSVSRVYMAGVGLTSFELDFFGRLKNLGEAAWQRYLATEQARRTVHINLVAGVAEAYFRLRTTHDLTELMQRTLVNREDTLKLVQAMFDTGVASALDLNQARSQVEAVRVDLSAMKRLQSQAENALQLLLGMPVPEDLPEPAIFGKEQLLASVPAGLPSDLLTRRPDILAAEKALLAANAEIGAARAAFFPNISLTGLLGFASPQLGGLFSSGNRYWQYSPQIQVPLFTGGGLRSNLELSEVRKNIAVAQYEKTIQTAFREVADALAGEATYTDQLDALRQHETLSRETVQLAKLRYETGVDSFLQVQTAEVNLYAVQQQFIQTGMESLVNRIELYKALGGGWHRVTTGADQDTSGGKGDNQD